MPPEHFRRSPAAFDAEPARTERRDGWNVVLQYENEGNGPHLVDLSHRTRWDVQDRNLSRMAPWGVAVPGNPGHCAFGNGILINRMNRTQASVWHLGKNPLDAPPDEPAYTNITEACLFLALLGREVFSIAEKLTSLDFGNPEKPAPYLHQAPLLHVPCQIVSLGRAEDRWGILFTCSRGYGKSMVEGILRAGTEFNLCPAGEEAFTSWLSAVI